MFQVSQFVSGTVYVSGTIVDVSSAAVNLSGTVVDVSATIVMLCYVSYMFLLA